MTYAEMLDALIRMNEADRRRIIRQHWQTVLGDGFVGYVQSQIDAGQDAVNGSGRGLGGLLTGPLGAALAEAAKAHLANVVAVWQSMKIVYQQIAKASAAEGGPGGMTQRAGTRQTMPRGVAVAPAKSCYRCGSPVAANGLCSGCLDHDADVEQDQRDYDQQLDHQERVRLEQDQIQQQTDYYDSQADFNYDTGYGNNY